MADRHAGWELHTGTTPLVLLILLAGLEAVPGHLYEAARWRQFRAITLPFLKPVLTMALIIRGVDAFRIFALPLAKGTCAGPPWQGPFADDTGAGRGRKGAGYVFSDALRQTPADLCRLPRRWPARLDRLRAG